MIDKLNKSDYKIKLINSQGVELKGYYFPANSRKWVMYVHGFAGGFDDFLFDIVNNCINSNINFLFAGNQGMGTETKFKKCIDGSKSEVLGGGCYENIDNILPDLDCFVNFALDNACEELIVIGYSFGCDKVVKYISSNQINCISKLVFISPQDMTNNCDSQMLAQAKFNVDNGKPNMVLDVLFLGFCPISSRTLNMLAKDKTINNFPYLTTNADFNAIRKINIPTYFVIGTNDQGIENSGKSAKECMQILTSVMPNAKFELVEGAKHTFKHYYSQLAEIINQIIVNQ